MTITHSLIHTIIIEDKQSLRNDLIEFLKHEPGIEIIGAYGSVKESISGLDGKKVDLLLMDIELPDGTSFDILEYVSPLPKIIFITAHNKYAIKAIKYGALDFLLRPFDLNEVRAAILRILPVQPEQLSVARQQFKEGAKRIIIPTQYYLKVVEFKDIVYFEGQSNYTSIFLLDGKKVVSSKNIKEYEDILPNSHFIRSHQSYLVNVEHIDLYHKSGYILLKNGVEIPVSVRRREFVIGFLKNAIHP